jgi:DNA-binding LytR/AlgR family response regulator
MKVLIVDNDRASLEETVFILKSCKKDLEIFAYDDPTKALKAEKKEDFDVAFLEIDMYGISGITFAKMLKDKHPKTNIIFLTACADFAIDALSLRASGYLLKPLTVEKVCDELNNLRYSP